MQRIRLFKLSDIEFDSEEDVLHYFIKRLRKDNNWKFRIRNVTGKPKIGAKGIAEGDIMLFSYAGKLVGYAIAATPRLLNKVDAPDISKEVYPYYIRIQANSFRRLFNISVKALETRINEQVQFSNSVVLHKTQGWPELPAVPYIENLLKDLHYQKINKYLYGWKLYVKYEGKTWTYETFECTYKEYKENRKAYKENCKYPQKWVKSKEPNDDWEWLQKLYDIK